MTKRKTAKQGRPKIDKEKARGTLMQVRLTDAEKKAFADAAELNGQSVSVWARSALRRVAQEVLEKSGRPVAFLPFQVENDPA